MRQEVRNQTHLLIKNFEESGRIGNTWRIQSIGFRNPFGLGSEKREAPRMTLVELRHEVNG